MFTRLASALAIAALLALAAPATASTVPKYKVSRVYMQCTGTTDIWNVDAIAFGEQPGWFTGKPTGSFNDGYGCGFIDPLALHDEDPLRGGYYDLNWAGTWTGNLSTLVVHGDVVGVMPVNTPIGVQLFIEGVDVTGEVLTTTRQTVQKGGRLTRIEFAITGLELVDFGNSEGYTLRNVRLRMFAASPSTMSIEWVWGATEALAGLTFNGDTRGIPTVKADTSRVEDD